MTSRPREFHPRALPGRVEAWRAGLGRFTVSRPFVCECHTTGGVERSAPEYSLAVINGRRGAIPRHVGFRRCRSFRPSRYAGPRRRRASWQPKLEIGRVDDPSEREGDAVAERAIAHFGPGIVGRFGTPAERPKPRHRPAVAS